MEAVLLAYCICAFLGYHAYFYFLSGRLGSRTGRRFNVYGGPSQAASMPTGRKC